MPDSQKTPLQRLVPLLMFLAMVGPMTLNVLQPAMPSVGRSFGSPRDTVQLTLSLYIFGMAIAQLIGGPMADRFGRKPVILTGLTLYTFASIGAAFAPTIDILIATRILQALGATVCLSLSRTIIGDVSDRATTARMIAYVTMVMVIAPIAAPNIGAALDAAFGWRAIFVYCALFGAAVFTAVLLILFETRPTSIENSTYRDVARRTWRLARNRAFMRYAAISSFASACFFIFIAAAPHLVIEVMGATPRAFGLWYIMLGIGYSLGNFTVARAVAKPERMMLVGGISALIGITIMLGLALAGYAHPAALFMPAVFFTFGNGLVLPNAMAIAIQTDREAAGAASGLLGFSQMFLGATFSYAVSWLPGETAVPTATMMLFCGLVALALTPRMQSKT